MDALKELAERLRHAFDYMEPIDSDFARGIAREIADDLAAIAALNGRGDAVAWYCEWFDADGSGLWAQYHDASDPLPQPHEWDDEPDRITPLYTHPPAADFLAVVEALRNAREWIGDGEHSDGLSRKYWTRKYAAVVDQVDAALASVAGNGNA